MHGYFLASFPILDGGFLALKQKDRQICREGLGVLSHTLQLKSINTFISCFYPSVLKGWRVSSSPLGTSFCPSVCRPTSDLDRFWRVCVSNFKFLPHMSQGSQRSLVMGDHKAIFKFQAWPVTWEGNGKRITKLRSHTYIMKLMDKFGEEWHWPSFSWSQSNTCSSLICLSYG